MPEESILAVEIYSNIKKYNDRLKTALIKRIPFGLNNFPLSIKMEAGNNLGLIKLLNDATGDVKLLAVLGIDYENKFTISFLALDKNDEVDKRHLGKGSSALFGQETWPKSSITFVKPDAEGARVDLPSPISK